ncbi:MAG: hypothetical protein D6689_17650 [Deltaproteobacteria bacterium]|nr:MAG: hypothetical protein D6689_17650 [Deltaproteobacteria bacterium]
MTARELLRWSALEARRRRRARAGLGRVPPAGWAAVAAAALAIEIVRRGGDEVSRLWIAAAVIGNAVVVFGAPFRMYWRRDTALLARLPLDGDVLYRVALARSAAAAARVAVALAVAACAFGAVDSWAIAGRHALLGAIGAVASAALGPAVALFAGALIASERAMALVHSLAGGEIGAPKTTWLGLLPGVAAAAVGAALLAGAPWAAGDTATAVGSPEALAVAAIGIAAGVLAASLPLARRWMGAAVREVAALDAVRLAHVDRVGPSALERACGRLLSRGARLVFDKDAAVARRRYPAPYLVMGLGVVALWIVAAVRPEAMTTWAAALLGAQATYAAVMARRLWTPPVEHAVLVRTLPIASGDVAAAKRAAAALRAAIAIGAGGVPVVARAPDPAELAVVVAAAAAVALLAGARADRRA